ELSRRRRRVLRIVARQDLGDHRGKGCRPGLLRAYIGGVGAGARGGGGGGLLAWPAPVAGTPRGLGSVIQRTNSRCAGNRTERTYEAATVSRSAKCRSRRSRSRPAPLIVLRSMIGRSLPEFSRLIAGTSWATIRIGSPTMARRPVITAS